MKAVIDAHKLSELQRAIRTIYVSAALENYIVTMVHATREHSEVELGVSPRGTLALYRAAQALAATQNRNHVIPDDVKQLAPHILSHRMIATSQSRLHGHDMSQVINDILKQTVVPVEQ